MSSDAREGAETIGADVLAARTAHSLFLRQGWAGDL